MKLSHSSHHARMRWPLQIWHLFVIGLWLFVGCLSGTNATLDPTVMAEVKQLVFSRGLPKDDILERYAVLEKNPDKAFAEREMQRLELEHERKVQEEIRTRPDLKPYLMALLDTSRGKVGNVLRALAKRDDLNHEDVEVVARTVASHLDNPVPYEDPNSIRFLQLEYLVAAMAVLGRDLTPAHEDLLLRTLAWPYDGQVNYCAADVLAESGVIRAIPALQAAIDRLKEHHDPLFKLIEKDLVQLKEKVPSKTASPTGATDQPTGTPASLPTAPPARVPVERTKHSWFWLLGIVVVIVVTALIVKSRPKSSGRGDQER